MKYQRSANLKRTRYIWSKNPENLTEKQRNDLGSLKDMHLETLRLCDKNELARILGIRRNQFSSSLSEEMVFLGNPQQVLGDLDLQKISLPLFI
jgi:hypothetical protein